MSVNVIGKITRCFLLGFVFIIVGCDSVPRELSDLAADEPATQSIDGKMTSIDAKRRIQQPRRGGLCPGEGTSGACCLPDLPHREKKGSSGCIDVDENCCTSMGGLFAGSGTSCFDDTGRTFDYCR